tara:strand:- start:198 stop:398 length:201 start_codon:yes stop_codon:yes gene_type:complete
MRRPKIKPYTPSKESLALQRKQLEEMNEKKSEIAEKQMRVAKRNMNRSLISSIADPDQQESTLGVA